MAQEQEEKETGTLKEIGYMLIVGLIIGAMFNTAITGNPVYPSGLIGGFLTGLLMYTFS